MMKFKIYLIAFGNGKIRTVEVPQKIAEEFCTTSEQMLELIFEYGQNDFQPQPLPSVSVGDVIELEKKFYMVKSIGFEKINFEI